MPGLESRLLEALPPQNLNAASCCPDPSAESWVPEGPRDIFGAVRVAKPNQLAAGFERLNRDLARMPEPQKI
jgi:hypothetical protein